MTRRGRRPENDSPMVDRVTFRLNSTDADKLEKMSEETGKSKTDLIKEALNNMFGAKNARK